MNTRVSDEDFQDFLVTLRRFTREKIIPAERQVVAEDAFPDAIVDEMGRLGLFGMTIPQDYGGLGLTMKQQCLARH